MGTDAGYFRYYKYGQGQPLKFDKGQPFANYDAVVGADVARSLNYELSDEIIISWLSVSKFSDHENKPFTIGGILERARPSTTQSTFP